MKYNAQRADSCDQEKLTVGEMLTQTYTDGFLVIHQGKIISEQYFNGMQPHNRHLLQSVSKSLTSILAAIFIDREVLDLNAVCGEYLSEFKDSAYGDATLQQLLDMTVAVDYTEDYHRPDAHISIHETAAGWRVHPKDAYAPEPSINAFSSLRFDIAREQAKAAEKIYMQPSGTPRLLEGIPVALKNEPSLEGDNTTNGSLILKDNIDTYNNPMTQHLLASGAIIHARTNVPEFCCMVFTSTPLHGITRSPWTLVFLMSPRKWLTIHFRLLTYSKILAHLSKMFPFPGTIESWRPEPLTSALCLQLR